MATKAVVNKGSVNWHPRTCSDRCAEKLNYLGNLAKAAFWKCEQNVQYCFLPIQPGLLGQENTKCKEVFKRILLGGVNIPLGVAMVPACFLGHSLTGLSNRLHSREFTYWEGNGKETLPARTKVFQLNPCLLPGGLPYSFGGLRTAGERMGELISTLKKSDPDLIFLCEFSETLSPRLYHHLKKDYKHFFVNIGSNALGIDACFCVVSRVPILSAKFIPAKIKLEEEQRFSYRGYFFLETTQHYYLFSHFYPYHTGSSKENRQIHLKDIECFVQSRPEKPWIILGDLNIDRNTPEYRLIMERGFVDVVGEQHGKVSTCAEGLEHGKVKNEESLDYFLTVKNQSVRMSTEVIDTYADPKTALSDHKALVATIG
jgi:hypothetical protein